MGLLLLITFFTQYADVYAPQKPLDVESGTTVSAASAELDFVYRNANGDSTISSPFLTRISFSPDGYNDFGVNLPIMWVLVNDAHKIFIGNMDVHYKRRIIGSLPYGYLSAKANAHFLSSPPDDSLGIRDFLGEARSTYGLGLAYTYEMRLLKEYKDIIGNLPLVGTVAVEDNFLYRDGTTKEWGTDFASGFAWGASVDVLPLAFVFAGASVEGTSDGVTIAPHLGVRWFWIDLAASYRIAPSRQSFNVSFRFFL